MKSKTKKPKRPSATASTKKVYQIEQIYWKDHYSHQSGWCKPDQLDPKPMINVSVGMRVHESRETVTLAQNMGNNHHLADCTTILKNCITKRKELGAVEYDE